MRPLSFRVLIVASGLIATTSAAAPVAAQAVSDSAANDSARTRATRLAPVAVTAIGPALALPRVPYSISIREPPAVGRMLSPLSLEEPLRGIAGLQLDNRHNIALGERISIRGFGARTQFGVRGVRVDVDGVPATMPDGQTTLSHVDAATVERAEVLRGAASAAHGNAAGGVVRLDTYRASANPHASLSTSVAERGTLTARASAEGTHGGWSGVARLSELRYEGFRQQSDARHFRASGRLARAGLVDTFALNLSGARYDAGNPGGLTDVQRSADPRAASATNLRFRTGEEGSHVQSGLTWRRTGVTSVDGALYGILRAVDNPIPFRVVDLERRAAGLRMTVSRSLYVAGREANVAVGGEHALQRDERRNYENLDGVRGRTVLDQGERVQNSGGHLRLSGAITPSLHLLAAVRGDAIEFRVRDRISGSGDADDSGERTMRAVSPSIGLSYRLAGESSLYANVATAFETPTTSELANRPSGAGGLNPELQPQRVTSWEGGVRGLVSAATRYSFAVFDARVRDALVPFEVTTFPGRQFYRNAKGLRHRGVELEGSIPMGRWRTTVAATITDARVVADTSASGSLVGRRVPGVAPGRLDAAVQGDLRNTSIELVLRAQSRSPVDDANASWSPGYAVVDVRALADAWMLGRVRMRPGVAVANVLDVRYDASVVANAARGRYFEPGPGRTVTLSLTVDAGRAGRGGR